MPQETRRPVRPQTQTRQATANRPVQRPANPQNSPAKKPLPPKQLPKQQPNKQQPNRQPKQGQKPAPKARIHFVDPELETRKNLRKKSRRRLFVLCFIISLVFVAIYWGIVALLIGLRPTGNEDALPLLIFTQGQRKEDHRLEVEEAYIGNVKYLSVSYLEKYMEITQFGDDKTRSFRLCESGEYATFYIGSEEAIINGNRVSIKEPALLKDGNLYLPLDFFEDKMNCFEFAPNNTTYGADVLSFNKEITPSFYVHSVTHIPPVVYDPAVHVIAPVETPTEETPTT